MKKNQRLKILCCCPFKGRVVRDFCINLKPYEDQFFFIGVLKFLSKAILSQEAPVRFYKDFNLDVLPGVEEGTPQLPLLHGHQAAGVEHGQKFRKLPDLGVQ